MPVSTQSPQPPAIQPPIPPKRGRWFGVDLPDFLAEWQFKLLYRVLAVCVAAVFSVVPTLIAGLLVNWRQAPFVVWVLGITIVSIVLVAELMRRGVYETGKRRYGDRQVVNALIDSVPPVAMAGKGQVWRGEPGTLIEDVPEVAALHTLTRGQLLLKRWCLDVPITVVALVLLAPIYVLISLLIRLDSEGPSLTLEECVGFRGRAFRMLKFRTFADQSQTSVRFPEIAKYEMEVRLAPDPRVTGVGRWLRRWSLDELPQLWNVLIGDMSLVGPRATRQADFMYYRRPYFARLGSPPGITGLFQISSGRLNSFDDMVALDLKYIGSWSLLLDFTILWRTVPAVLFAEER